MLSALAAGVASVAFTAGMNVPTIVAKKTASTSPVTDRKAAFGLSASRRVASSADGPRVARPNSRAAAAVRYGPASTRPTIVTSRPG